MKKEFITVDVLGANRDAICPDVFIIKLEDRLAETPKPGQFVVLEPLNKISVMPRPFSVFCTADGSIFLAIKKTGENTRLYSELKTGDKIKISGPHGRPFVLNMKKKYIFVGGGIGAAGLFYLASNMADKNNPPDILLGARKKEDIFGAQYFEHAGIRNIRAITEEGENGGKVTDLLNDALKHDYRERSVIVACGPKLMLRAVAEMAKNYGNKCYLLMEEIMACGGSGACYGCVVPMKQGPPKRLCQDGPIFRAEEIDFSKIKDAQPAKRLESKHKKTDEPLRVVLGGQKRRTLVLNTPIMYASGCVDLRTLLNGHTDFSKVGAILAKGIELKSRPGNATPRVCEVYGGMLNAIGLQGIGVKKFKSKILPELIRFNKPIIANISGATKEEYAEVASELAETEIAGIEENISCPNVDEGGMLFGQNGISAYGVVKAVRRAAPKKFLIVKLTPNVTNIAEIAKCVEEAGADAISLINTVVGMDIDVKTRRPKLANIKGGYSGPGILPIALAKVYEVAMAVKIPIIGMGGIQNSEDAAKFIIAGASAVAVGTGLFKNPKAITEIYDGLLEIMKLHGANHIHDLRGSLIV